MYNFPALRMPAVSLKSWFPLFLLTWNGSCGWNPYRPTLL